MNEKSMVKRIIFRPTKEQRDRIDKLMKYGRFKTESEFMRTILNEGLPKYEKKIKQEMEDKL